MIPEDGIVSSLDPARKRKALITGGAGFIGSHLSELLLADGWEVYALDDVSTGSLENIAHLLENPQLPPRRRVRSLACSRERVGPQVRRRVPPRRRGRRPPDRRAARPHAHDEHPRDRDGARVLHPVRQAGSRRLYVRGLRRPSRREAVARVVAAHVRPHYGEPLGVRRLEGRRRVPHARLPRRARPGRRDRPPLQHRRATSVRAVRNGHSAVRRERSSRIGRSRSTATGRRRGASATCRMRFGRSRGSWRPPTVSGEIFNVGSPNRISILDLAKRVIEATESESDYTFVPYDRVYGTGHRGHAPSDSGDREDRDDDRLGA